MEKRPGLMDALNAPLSSSAFVKLIFGSLYAATKFVLNNLLRTLKRG